MPTETTESAVNADLGIMHLILHEGDWVLKTAFAILVLMSILSWSIILYRVFARIITNSKSKKHLKLLNSNQYRDYSQAYADMKGYSPIKLLVGQALESKSSFAEAKGPLATSLNYSDYLQRNIRYGLEKNSHDSDGGLTVLASVGATAPFIGLFGTVWGIYHALINVAKLGNVNIGVIAGPIGEALIATAAGLFVAIPAVLAYNLISRQNKVQQRTLDSFAHDLYNSFLVRE